MLLKQARSGFKSLINENRQTITVKILDDPDDTWSTFTTKTFTGRISHEAAGPFKLQAGTAGLSTNLGRFLQVEYDIDYLVVDQIITDQDGKQWKLGAVDPLSKFKGIHGYQAPLHEAV